MVDWASINPYSVRLSAEDGEFLDALDYPIALNSFATSPACRVLKLSLFPRRDPRFETVVVVDRQGVRCAKVLQSFATYWDGPAPTAAAAAVRRDEGLSRTAEVSRDDARGQELAFEGWSDPAVWPGGTVVVEGGGFWI